MTDEPANDSGPIEAAPDAPAGLAKEVATLGKSSVIYLVPLFLTRGLSFVLTPIYTRYLSPEEYGIIGLAGTMLPLLSLFFGLCMHNAASRLHHAMRDDVGRARLDGTVLTLILTVPLALALTLEILGSFGMFAPFRTVPYSPYLRLMVWAAFLAPFGSLAQNLLVVRALHRRAALLGGFAASATAMFTVLLVIVLHRGAAGQLEAMLATNAVVAAWALVIAWRLAKPVLDLSIARQVLVFSLPLVPHELSKWGLAASDRIILERYVSSAELGQYSFAYAMTNSINIVIGALSLAFLPIVNRKLAAGDPRREVPQLGSVIIVVVAWVSLGVALVMPPLLEYVTPSSYHRSVQLIPALSIGFFLQGLYGVWSQGTYFARRTGVVAVVTLVGVTVNIGLNLILVPRYGVNVAVLTTILGYTVMAAAHALVARRIQPVIAWQHGRTFRIVLAAGVTYGLSRLVVLGGLGAIALEAVFALICFPAVLLLSGAVTTSEAKRLRARLRRKKSPA